MNIHAGTHTTVPDIHRDLPNANNIISDVHRGVSNTRATVSVIHPTTLKNREDTDSRNPAVSGPFTMHVTE